MPFGAVYGALFLMLMAVWAVGAALPSARPEGMPGAIPAIGLAVAALACAIGLLAGRPWARWLSLALLLGTAGVQIVRPIAGATVGMLLLLGSVVASVLLLAAMRTEASQRRPAFAPVLAGSALAGGLVFVFGLSVAPADSAVSSEEIVRPAFLSQGIDWKDFTTGMQLARSEGRPMMVSFETAWCGYCKKMQRTTWKDPGVADRLAELVPVRVDADAEKRLAERYSVQGYPTFLLLDPDGSLRSRSGGYQSPRQFLAWLESTVGRGSSDRARRVSR